MNLTESKIRQIIREEILIKFNKILIESICLNEDLKVQNKIGKSIDKPQFEVGKASMSGAQLPFLSRIALDQPRFKDSRIEIRLLHDPNQNYYILAIPPVKSLGNDKTIYFLATDEHVEPIRQKFMMGSAGKAYEKDPIQKRKQLSQ